jgi:hypothetical protein
VIFSLQRGRKFLKEMGMAQTVIGELRGDTQMCCNINETGPVDTVYGVNLPAYRQKTWSFREI